MPYKLHVVDRNYDEWSISNTETMTEVDGIDTCSIFNPIESKLFSNDIFENKENEISLLHSSIRCTSQMPGVLILENNKTYGRYKAKLLYRCVPDDKRLPIFLVPYAIKKTGFSKKLTNKYVTFKFKNWSSKHPMGTVESVLGDVDNLNNFYEYQLFCKSLYASIQNFTKAAATSLKKKSNEEFVTNIMKRFPSIEDRRHNKILSIDPVGSVDFDDAFEIFELGENHHRLSIYIANVPIWMDILNLWESFTQRIATIYLPDRKRPMLPTILSDCLCSLQENEIRFAFTIDLEIKDGLIISKNYANTAICVYKNYRYEDSTLINDENYMMVLDVIRTMTKNYSYMGNVKNSHDLIMYLMILMNYNSACEMIKYGNGIYRSVIYNKETIIPDSLSDDVIRFIKIWNSASGQYVLHIDKQQHDFLELESYIHITSPIRRLVDLLNMIQLQTNLGIIKYSEKAHQFYKDWINKIDYINTTMRAIRKIQYDCSLLEMCVNEPDIMTVSYTGYVFDKIMRNDKLFQYLVYLPKIKMLSRITLKEDFDNYSEKNFRLYLFHDESSLKRKIRLHLIR